MAQQCAVGVYLTGYGAQTRLFAPRIRDLGHRVAISAFWGLNGAPMEWEGMAVFPGDETFGNRLLLGLVEQHEADLVISLVDPWVLDAKKMNTIPLACWTPIDRDPCMDRVSRFLEQSGARPIAMSRFGKRMLRDEGLDPLFVPHGIDTRVFRPREDADAMRRRMKIPDDGFVIGMVANNKSDAPPRKAFPQVFQAFAQLRAEHDDAYLYMHCHAAPADGINLAILAERCGIPSDAIRYTNPLAMELGMSDERIAELYTVFDVLANPSYGEGFGIPLIEAQACGTPVIATDWTAMTELCGPGSWLVGGDRWYDAIGQSFFKCPSVSEILDAMRAAYEQRGQGPNLEARQFALDYDANVVTKRYWRPVLAALREMLAERETVSVPARPRATV